MMMDVTELKMDVVEDIVSRLERFGAIVEMRSFGGRVKLIC